MPGEELRPGDLLFFDSTGVTVFGNRASHVGLPGRRQMIHAANEADGVIVSRPFEVVHGPRLIGGAAHGDLGDDGPDRDAPPWPHRAPRRRRTLPLLAGPTITRNQWNGGPFPVDWSAAAGWAHEVNGGAGGAGGCTGHRRGDHDGDAVHARATRSQVLTVWDAAPQDGPSGA